MKQTGPNLPFGYTTFCDDIRYEVGEKHSIMGIYSGELRFSVPPPAVIPQLCARIEWICDIDKVPDGIEFVVYKDTPSNRNIIGEYYVDIDREDVSGNDSNSDIHDPESPTVASFSFTARLSMLEFTEECKLRVRARIDKKEYRVGALKILFAE